MEEFGTTTDVFNSLSYQEVIDEQVPNGVESVIVTPEGRAPLRIEAAIVLPERKDQQEGLVDVSRVIVQLPGFPNNLEDRGRETEYIPAPVAPNRHLLRSASLATATNVPVIALGFPGGEKADTLPADIRQAVTKGDYAELTRYYVKLLKDSGVSEVDVDGYSLGGAMTPDFCQMCLINGISVKSIFWGAVANVEYTDGIFGMAKRFLSIGGQEDYDRYAADSIALSQEAERHKRIAKGLGATALGRVVGDTIIPIVKKFGGLLGPTQFAMGRSIVFGKWRSGELENDILNPTQRMQIFLSQSPQTKVYMYGGSADSLAPSASMRSMAEDLGVEYTEFDGWNHSLRDDLPTMAKYIASRI